MSHKKAGEAVSYQHRWRRARSHSNIQRTNPIVAYRAVPLSQIHSLPLGMALLPEGLPMLRP
jgi:hypothetical protein